MSLNSINTNTNAYVALQSLNSTNTSLAQTQKEIATGYRVSDATDDGGAFAVAQTVRSDVNALTSVNQQLGNAQGLVTTAVTSLTSISDAVGNADNVDGSTYNGQTLLGAASGTVAGTAKTIINNEAGSTSTLSAENASTFPNTLAALIGGTFSRSAAGVDTFTTPTAATAQTTALAALQTGAGYDTAQTTLNDQLNQASSDSNFLNAQITFNSSKIDSLNTGLGALVDADLSQESALLQSEQIKQQLGTQALSIANQSPQALLSLFKG